jgi:addiction module HigA family antidote
MTSVREIQNQPTGRQRYNGSRLTFRIDTAEREIYDLNLEDYH